MKVKKVVRLFVDSRSFPWKQGREGPHRTATQQDFLQKGNNRRQAIAVDPNAPHKSSAPTTAHTCLLLLLLLLLLLKRAVSGNKSFFADSDKLLCEFDDLGREWVRSVLLEFDQKMVGSQIFQTASLVELLL